MRSREQWGCPPRFDARDRLNSCTWRAAIRKRTAFPAPGWHPKTTSVIRTVQARWAAFSGGLAFPCRKKGQAILSGPRPKQRPVSPPPAKASCFGLQHKALSVGRSGGLAIPPGSCHLVWAASGRSCRSSGVYGSGMGSPISGLRMAAPARALRQAVYLRLFATDEPRAD